MFCLTILFSPKIYAVTNAEEDTFGIFMDLFKSILNTADNNTKDSVNSPSSVDINQLLSGDNMSAVAGEYMGQIAGCIQNRSTYETAANLTGVQWQLIAAIHFREGGCDPNNSVASGRPIGSVEPDRQGDCSTGDPNSLVIPVGDGCGFGNITDSAIWAARHLIGKIGKVPSSFQELVEATAAYNGWGNVNCNGSMSMTGYEYCPPAFPGDDHSYAMNLFDNKHNKMYVRYATDEVLSVNASVDTRPGVMTAMQLISLAAK